MGRLHVLSVSAWDLYSYSSFLPQPIGMHLLDRWISDYKLTLCRWECERLLPPRWAGDWSSVGMGESPSPWHIKGFIKAICLSKELSHHSLCLSSPSLTFAFWILNPQHPPPGADWEVRDILSSLRIPFLIPLLRHSICGDVPMKAVKIKKETTKWLTESLRYRLKFQN